MPRRPHSPASVLLAGAVVLLALAHAARPARAQEGDPARLDAAGAAAARVPQELRSARATVDTFLSSFSASPEHLGGRDPLDVAASCLDLSGLPRAARALKGPELAVQLKEVVDRIAYVEVGEIPDDPVGPPWVFHRSGAGEIVVARAGDGRWLFTQSTVADIPSLARSVAGREAVEGVTRAPRTLPGWMRSKVPSPLQRVGFVLEHWQWAGLFALVLLGLVLDKLIVALLQGLVRGWLGRKLVRVEEDVLATSLRPSGLVVMAVAWLFGLWLLDLPAGALAVLVLAAKFVGITAVVWLAYRLVDLLSAVLEAKARSTTSRFDDLLVPLLRKTLKVFVTAFGLVFIADSFVEDVTSLVAGLGIGGVAVALAAQDTVKNLFGSLTVLLDRPFQVGDWIVVEGIEGTVEEMGFRSTRIRTFYNSLVSLPNARLISAEVDNYGARRYRRWSTTLGLTYDTPAEKVDAFCEGVRELIRRGEATRKDYFEVHFKGFGDSALEVMLYMFFVTSTWTAELEARHSLGLEILRLAERLGVSFAFPTRTVHLLGGESPSMPAG